MKEAIYIVDRYSDLTIECLETDQTIKFTFPSGKEIFINYKNIADYMYDKFSTKLAKNFIILN